MAEEAIHIQHPEIEILIIITQELLRLNQLETIIVTQQELTLIHNRQEVIIMNQLRFVPMLQVQILDHLHTVAEVMVVEVIVAEAEAEDLHLVVEEDKKLKHKYLCY